VDALDGEERWGLVAVGEKGRPREGRMRLLERRRDGGGLDLGKRLAAVGVVGETLIL
jgi:hypothetical protein